MSHVKARKGILKEQSRKRIMRGWERQRRGGGKKVGNGFHTQLHGRSDFSHCNKAERCFTANYEFYEELKERFAVSRHKEMIGR